MWDLATMMELLVDRAQQAIKVGGHALPTAEGGKLFCELFAHMR